MVLAIFIILFGVVTSVAYGSPVPSDLQPRIIGGVDAPEAYSPFMAALIFGNKVVFLVCGGSIISKTLVLTAAHCIEGFIQKDGSLIGSFHIRVGSNQWNSGGTIAKIEDYYMHPDWNMEHIKNDIAALVLKDSLDLNDRVAIVGLDLDEFVEGGERVVVTGWGRTGPRIENNTINLAPVPYDLQKLHTNTISHEQCQQQMSLVGGDAAPTIQRDVEVCTFHSHGVGMCSGDSGSALVMVDTRKQIGVVSWGWNCAVGGPDVFVRVWGMRGFLKPILDKHV